MTCPNCERLRAALKLLAAINPDDDRVSVHGIVALAAEALATPSTSELPPETSGETCGLCGGIGCYKRPIPFTSLAPDMTCVYCNGTGRRP